VAMGGSVAGSRANAGPSTALRFAQDDNFVRGWDWQVRVLSLRESLAMR
jgi:hypothetical protein